MAGQFSKWREMACSVQQIFVSKNDGKHQVDEEWRKMA